MITQKRIAALRYLIFASTNGNDLSKRILALLIDRSEGLTKEVCLTLTADRDGLSADEIDSATHGIDFMLSSNGKTHLHEILSAMGSELSPSVHYGDFDPTRTGDAFSSAGQFEGYPSSVVHDPELLRENMPLRYTIWLSKEPYSRQANLVTTTREELELIDLKKSGLYPELEESMAR